ncbi:MAG TPA: hypothetical protein VKA64_10470 [Gammaproteobacteria bacterium]|nr:hypothetical protein [Gammaproteobacteria bacterium]
MNEDVRVGACYSNGSFGRHWVVRQVTAVYPCERLREQCVEYRVVVGENRRRRFTATREEFQRWMSHEVVRNENSWERAE